MSDSENQFGKYELLSRIAAGGMAEIFKARFSPAPGVTKNIVIKRILPHYAANKAFIAMFTNEAKIAMGLSHGNIAQVFDFGDIDGDWFLAMELVEGQPLSKLLRRLRGISVPHLPEAYGVAIAIELLKGLHYAHTRLDDQGRPLKIVHRDVSPQNVLVSYEGQVKIVDFGIAKARESREDPSSGPVKGKYIYFSPEQARGKELDARTDVFAAGIVLYEMLCGRLPFQGKMIEVLSKLVRGEFPAPREVNPELSQGIEKILLTALAQHRDDRYESAGDFEQALTAHLHAIAPGFKPQNLAHLMSLLFEEELVKEGRPVQIPKEFAEEVRTWRREMAEPLVEEEEPPRLPAPIVWDSDDNPLGTREMMSPEPPLKRRLFLLLALALVLGLGAGGWWAYQRFSAFTLEVESVPPGAQLKVDGDVWPHPTPVTVPGLKAWRAHQVEVSAPGHLPYQAKVEPRPGGTVRLRAALEALPPPEPTEPTPPTEPKPPPPGPDSPPKEPEVAMRASWPVAEVTVNARAHAFAVPAATSARIRLEPKHAYKVWTEGKVSLGGAKSAPVGECLYFVDSSRPGAGKEPFGVLGPKPLVLKNASVLYAWLSDQKSDDDRGALKVRLTDLTTKQTSTLVVDARANAFVPGEKERFTLGHLKPGEAYELKLRAGNPPATLQGERGGELKEALLGVVTPHGNGGARVLELGKPLKLKGASELWLSLPDDGTRDNQGSLVLEIRSGL